MILKFVIGLSVLLGSISFHDLHLSKTDLHYKSDQEALQVMVSIFIDDLELAIKNDTGVEYDLLSDDNSEVSDSLIVNYINTHLEISIDEENILPLYIGKEQSEDFEAFWCYLEIENLKTFKALEIKNTILLEEFDDQKNAINFKIDRKSKNFEFLDHKTNFKKIVL